MRKFEDAARAAPQSALPKGEGSTAPGAAQSTLPDFGTLAERAEHKGHALAASIMRLQVRVIEMTDGKLVFTRAPHFTDDISPELREALLAATGKRWQVEERPGADAPPSLHERLEAEQRAAQDRIRNDPMVVAAFAVFPDAELIQEPDAPPPVKSSWSH